MKKRDPFMAIADPTRRKIVDLLCDGPQKMGTLSQAFDISRPAVAKHIKLMEECGLVQVNESGRERFASINFLELQKISIWIANYEKFWDQRLVDLGTFLDGGDLDQ